MSNRHVPEPEQFKKTASLINAFGHIFHFLPTKTRGPKPPHKGPDAGSHHHIRNDAFPFQSFNDSDMRQTVSRAAAQSQPKQSARHFFSQVTQHVPVAFPFRVGRWKKRKNPDP